MITAKEAREKSLKNLNEIEQIEKLIMQASGRGEFEVTSPELPINTAHIICIKLETLGYHCFAVNIDTKKITCSLHIKW